MPILGLSPDAGPLFLSKNYFNADSDDKSDLIVSTGAILRSRLYDMDPTGQWTSVGSVDGTTETITCGLYELGTQISRSISCLALLNINLKNFLIEYSNDNGSTYTTLADYRSIDYGDDDLLLIFPAITANKLKITMTNVQSGAGEKLIGLIVAALIDFQAPAMSQYKPKRIMNRNEVRLADGTVDYTYLLWADNSYELYAADMSWRAVETADRDNFRDLVRQIAPFLCIPEPGDEPREIHLCIVDKNSYNESYSSRDRSIGRDISFSIMEIGSG